MSVASLSSTGTDHRAFETEDLENKNLSEESTPKPISFVHPVSGEIATFYLNDNPWKPTEKKLKYYRFCVVCGNSKKSIEEWTKEKILKEGPYSPSVCEQTKCWEKIPLINSVVAQQHLEICKDFDKRRAQYPRETGFYESFSRKASIGLDLKDIDLTDPCIPQEYKVKLLNSNSDLFERVQSFINIYFEYKAKMEIEVGKTIYDTTDPFLCWLASQYRQHMILLQPFLRSRL